MYYGNKVKILVVSSKYPPEYSGSGLRAHRTYKRFAKKFGFKYKVLCSSVTFNKSEYYEYEGIPVYRIARKLFRKNLNSEKIEIERESSIAKMLRKLKNGINYALEASLTWIYLIREGRDFDLIHIFGNNYVTAATMTYAKATKKSLIVEICNISKSYRPYEPWFLKAFFGRTLHERSKVICISERIKEIYLKSELSRKSQKSQKLLELGRFLDVLREQDKDT